MIANTANKTISFVLIIIFVAIGIVGVILPILPGIPFLFIAAIMASRHSPALENFLQQHPYGAKSLRQSHRFSRLSFMGKVKFCCWVTVKIIVDSVEWGVKTFAKLFKKK